MAVEMAGGESGANGLLNLRAQFLADFADFTFAVFVLPKKYPDSSIKLAQDWLPSTGPQRYFSHSLVSVRWMPRSRPGLRFAYSAASPNPGQGTIALAELMVCSSRALKIAALTEWHIPRSSA